MSLLKSCQNSMHINLKFNENTFEKSNNIMPMVCCFIIQELYTFSHQACEIKIGNVLLYATFTIFKKKFVTFLTSFTFLIFIMVALWNRAVHYIFILWFLLSFFPRLISAVADWKSAILPHMMLP